MSCLERNCRMIDVVEKSELVILEFKSKRWDFDESYIREIVTDYTVGKITSEECNFIFDDLIRLSYC